MPDIPLLQKFHTVADDVVTVNRGSAVANANRTIFTMQDIINTVDSSGGGGGIGGSITDGQIAFGDTTADEITGSDNFKISGDVLLLGENGTIKNSSNTYTGFGFYNGGLNFQVKVGNQVHIDCIPGLATKLERPLLQLFGNTKLALSNTVAGGIDVTGQMNVTALNTAPAANNSAGTLGEIRWTEGFVYICTLTGVDGAANWNRATLTSGW